jgi:hypothetical protein
VMLRPILVMVMLNDTMRTLVEAAQCTFICEDLWPEGASLSSCVSTNHQKEQNKHWAIEIHTNVTQLPYCSWGFVDSILHRAKAHIDELINCFLKLLTIDNHLLWHVPWPKWTSRRHITDSSNTWSTGLSAYSALAPCLLLMLMDGAVSQTDPYFIIFPSDL